MSYLGEDIKKLGFGFMRLPMNGEEVDIEQTKKNGGSLYGAWLFLF